MAKKKREIAPYFERYNKSRTNGFRSNNAYKKYLGQLEVSDWSKFSREETLLNAESESNLFASLHYCRYKVKQSRGSSRNKWRNLMELLRLRAFNANVGLIYKCMEMRAVRMQARDDVLSVCHEALLRSIDLFDPWRGFRFSTYACTSIFQAISREYERIRKNNANRENIDPGDVVVHPEKNDFVDSGKIEAIKKLVLSKGGASLSNLERKIVLERFGISSEKFKRTPKTLAQVGENLGFSKERIRQIEDEVLGKLRLALIQLN